MDFKKPPDLQSLIYSLQAIQKIPGDTAGEKFKWIARLTSHEISKDHEQLPPELLSISRVETAIKEKRLVDIALALKSKDLTIINRAFRASWFFDGSHKIIDIAYFCESLFPYVSVKTRKRIMVTLAHKLFGKDSVFAQEMFTAVTNMYDVQTALPLIMACDESFAYKTIVEKELVLPVNIVKKIFRRNPDLIVRFLKLSKPWNEKTTEWAPFTININTYKYFLSRLVKKRLENFLELCEMHEANPPDIVLSNASANILLTKAEERLIKKPLVYIHMLPLERINENLMEGMFPGLLPANISSFNTDEALNYLKHYPRDKKYDLLSKSYKNKYNADLLDKIKNVTSNLIQLLPAEERIKQARLKNMTDRTQIEWLITFHELELCYLPISVAIPALKEKINKASNEENRLNLFLQMINICKINEDDDALSDTLEYFLNRHKNESFRIFDHVLHELMELYDYLNEKQTSLTMDIIRIFYVKSKFLRVSILFGMMYFKLLHNMPIKKLIDMFLKGNGKYVHVLDLNRFKKHPQYERQCLATFADQIQKKHFESIDEKTHFVMMIVNAMYNFNDRHKTSRIKIEKMTIGDYPGLKIILKSLCCKEIKFLKSDAKDFLQKNEPELYRSWFPSKIANVKSGDALALLKRDLQSVLDKWEQYLEDCMWNCHHKRVQRFVRATRWYKDLPIKFAERCMKYINDNNTDKIPYSIFILAILLNGKALKNLVKFFVSKRTTTTDARYPDAKYNYKIIRYALMSMRVSNPPVPLNLIVEFWQRDYLSIASTTLYSVSRRTRVSKVAFIAQKLMWMDVSTRKLHAGIRLMFSIASVRELTSFLQREWALTERQDSIQQILLKAFQELILTKLSPKTWFVYRQTMLSINNDSLLSELKFSAEVPNKYLVEYLDLWLKVIDNLQEMRLDVQAINRHFISLLKELTARAIFHLLPDKLVGNILRRFLFRMEFDSNESFKISIFAISYILSENRRKDKHTSRIEVLANVFRDAVTTYWDVASPTNLYFYPVNKAVRLFVDTFVHNYFKKFHCNNLFINPEIIDNIQTMFLSVLSPKKDVWSYLLLLYARKLQECTLTKESLGLKIGQELHKLIGIFSSQLLIPFMAQVLEYFLRKIYNSDEAFEEVMLNVMEGLVEAGNTNSCFMAVTMLPQKIHELNEARYKRLIEKFREMHDELAIMAVLNNHLNKTDLVIFTYKKNK